MAWYGMAWYGIFIFQRQYKVISKQKIANKRRHTANERRAPYKPKVVICMYVCAYNIIIICRPILIYFIGIMIFYNTVYFFDFFSYTITAYAILLIAIWNNV